MSEIIRNAIPPDQYNLRPVYNKKLGSWVILHDQWCQRGETSIVATVTTTLDDARDAELARLICDRFNRRGRS